MAYKQRTLSERQRPLCLHRTRVQDAAWQTAGFKKVAPGGTVLTLPRSLGRGCHTGSRLVSLMEEGGQGPSPVPWAPQEAAKKQDPRPTSKSWSLLPMRHGPHPMTPGILTKLPHFQARQTPSALSPVSVQPLTTQFCFSRRSRKHEAIPFEKVSYRKSTGMLKIRKHPGLFPYGALEGTS